MQSAYPKTDRRLAQPPL